MQILSVVIFANLFFKNSSLTRVIKKYFYQIGFSVSLIAIVVSLTYSIGFGFAPCTLCWWARILLFPQIIIFLVAWIKNTNPKLEILIMSLLGILVSGYHTFIDFGGTQVINCEAGAVSCLQRYVFEFGYITIPVMALTGFVFLTVLALHQYKK